MRTAGETMEWTMGALSVLMIAVGAVLTLPTDKNPGDVDMRLMGVVLLLLGTIALITSALRGSMMGFRSTRVVERHVDQSRRA